jgi:hypothetical protein
MKTAGKAMKDIHGNLTIDKVDATMYVPLPILQARRRIAQKRSLRC